MRSQHSTTTSVSSALRSFGTAALVALAPMACDSGDVEPDDEELLVADAEDADEITQEIVDNLRRAGYPDGEIEIRDDGTVVAGGDAVVGLEASREMIGIAGDGSESDDANQFRQYRTTNLVSAAVHVICIDGSELTGVLGTALDNAIANFNNQDLTFDMVRTNGANAGCDAEITAHAIKGSTSGSAGFPSGGLPYGTINIGSAIPGNYGLDVTTHVITHELGHCIGFRHSDYFNRSISCGWGGNEGPGIHGAVYLPGTPVGAVYNGSVMNSCYNAGCTGQWTASDIDALVALYASVPPAAPDPLVAQTESCFGLFSMYWTEQLATRFELHGSTSSTFSSPFMLYSGTGTDTIIDVDSGTWYLRARACNVAGCSDWTNQVSAERVDYCL